MDDYFNVELPGDGPHTAEEILAEALKKKPDMEKGIWGIKHWGDRDPFTECEVK